MPMEQFPQHPDRVVLTGFGNFSPEEFAAFLKFSGNLGLTYPPGLLERTIDPDFNEPQPPLTARSIEAEAQDPDFELSEDDFQWTFGRYGGNPKSARALYRTLIRSSVGRPTHESSPYQTSRRYLAFRDVEELFIEDQSGQRALDEVERVGPRNEEWLRLVVADKRAQIDEVKTASAEAA